MPPKELSSASGTESGTRCSTSSRGEEHSLGSKKKEKRNGGNHNKLSRRLIRRALPLAQ